MLCVCLNGMSWQCYLPAMGVPAGVRVMGGSRENAMLHAQLKIESRKTGDVVKRGSLDSSLVPDTDVVQRKSSFGSRRNDSSLASASFAPPEEQPLPKHYSRITESSLSLGDEGIIGGTAKTAAQRQQIGSLRPPDSLTIGLYDRRTDSVSSHKSSGQCQPRPSLGPDLVPICNLPDVAVAPVSGPKPFRRVYGLN